MCFLRRPVVRWRALHIASRGGGDTRLRRAATFLSLATAVAMVVACDGSRPVGPARPGVPLMTEVSADSNPQLCMLFACRDLSNYERDELSWMVGQGLQNSLNYGDQQCWEMYSRLNSKLSTNSVYAARWMPDETDQYGNPRPMIGAWNNEEPNEIYLHVNTFATPGGMITNAGHEAFHDYHGTMPSSMNRYEWESLMTHKAEGCAWYAAF